jgi:hypothetical protein
MKRRDAGATQEISFEDILEEIPILTARKARPCADATQEIQAADILESVHVAPTARDGQPPAPASIAPFAVDVTPHGRRADSTFLIEPAEPVIARRHLGWVVGSVLSVAVGILVVAFIRKGENQEVATATAMAPSRIVSRSPASSPRGATPSMPTAALPTPDPSLAADAVPVVALDSLPRVGTIVAPRNLRLWVDGSPVRGSSATVRCGVHRVTVGRRVRAVDVPCGGEVAVR